MNLVYSFIGKLPSYTIESIQQARKFYDGDIYLILDDRNSPYLQTLSTYNVKFVWYEEVTSQKFKEVNDKYGSRFCVCHHVVGRELLFMRTFERFYLLEELMKKYSLENCLFLEIDNTIYFNPLEFLELFRRKGLSYTFDNVKRCSGGITFARDVDSLAKLTSYFSEWIPVETGFLTEMTSMYDFYMLNKEIVQMLPTHWKTPKYPVDISESFNDFRTIFDAFSLGIFMFGLDPVHTGGKIVRGQKNKFSEMDYTPYEYRWEKDEKGRNIPYILTPIGFVRINNLHIHSKDLKSAMS
jgi:hypothetical protein